MKRDFLRELAPESALPVERRSMELWLSENNCPLFGPDLLLGNAGSRRGLPSCWNVRLHSRSILLGFVSPSGSCELRSARPEAGTFCGMSRACRWKSGWSGLSM
eukprot:6523-Rhodomonas_salina.3